MVNSLSYSVFRWLTAVSATILSFGLSQPARASLAEARITSFFGEGNNGHSVYNSGADRTNANLLDSYNGASSTGTGSVEGVADDPLDPTKTISDPVLRAFATGTHFDDGIIFIPGGSTVEVSWSDVLRYDNPSLLDPEFLGLNPYLYFVSSLSGSITNKGAATVSLDVVTGDQLHDYRSEADINGPANVNQGLILRLPANALLPFISNGIGHPAHFTFGMSIYGGTDMDNIDGTTSFATTAKFDYIYIADANGNYIPGSENIHVVGDNGPYTMQVIPEPRTCALMVAGLLILIGLKRRRLT